MVEADGRLYEMRHQDEFGDGIDAEDITVDEWVKFWHTELIKHLAANTRGNYAERYYQNIQPVIGRMKLKNVKPMHCTKEEQRKFLDVARRSRNYYQYAFLLETGLRTGELIALTRDNVDRERRTLTIRKTMEFRYKRQDQKQKKSFNMKDLVFLNFRTGMPNKNSSYDTHLYKLCDAAGIKRFCMHALRHTYATRAIESGLAAEKGP